MHGTPHCYEKIFLSLYDIVRYAKFSGVKDIQGLQNLPLSPFNLRLLLTSAAIQGAPQCKKTSFSRLSDIVRFGKCPIGRLSTSTKSTSISIAFILHLLLILPRSSVMQREVLYTIVGHCEVWKMYWTSELSSSTSMSFYVWGFQ